MVEDDAEKNKKSNQNWTQRFMMVNLLFDIGDIKMKTAIVNNPETFRLLYDKDRALQEVKGTVYSDETPKSETKMEKKDDEKIELTPELLRALPIETIVKIIKSYSKEDQEEIIEALKKKQSSPYSLLH